MSLIHYEPYRLLSRNNELNRLFDSFLPNFEREDVAAAYDWTPAVDIREEGNRYIIHADVPGIKPEDIELSLEDGVLIIRGERQLNDEKISDGYRRVERVRGSFYRRFSLPDTADHEKVTAKCTDGVLEVVIEKQDKVLPRKIKVNA